MGRKETGPNLEQSRPIIKEDNVCRISQYEVEAIHFFFFLQTKKSKVEIGTVEGWEGVEYACFNPFRIYC